jgi:hypothetical protein
MSISQKAVLIRPSFKEWTGVKKDRKASKEVALNHGFSETRGKYMKNLVSKARLEPVKKAIGAIRQFVYDNTLPWADGGQRLLPTKGYTEFMDKLATLEDGFRVAVTNLQTNYVVAVTEAQRELNGLFDPRDYPKDIGSRFDFTKEINPVPDTTDIRCDLSDAEKATIRADVENQIAKRQEAAMASLWKRIYRDVAHMSERLADEKAIFRDSLVDNVIEIVRVASKLNISGDPEIDLLRAEIREKLCKYPAQTLRDNRWARNEVAVAAHDIEKRLFESGKFEIEESEDSIEFPEAEVESTTGAQPGLFDDSMLMQIGA